MFNRDGRYDLNSHFTDAVSFAVSAAGVSGRSGQINRPVRRIGRLSMIWPPVDGLTYRNIRREPVHLWCRTRRELGAPNSAHRSLASDAFCAQMHAGQHPPGMTEIAQQTFPYLCAKRQKASLHPKNNEAET